MRVGAMISMSGNDVQFLGYGEYLGKELPSEEMANSLGGMVQLAREMNLPTPVIHLDCGDTVYGFECWWSPAEEMEKKLVGKNVIEVSISDYRDAGTME
jgi:hypothetical protein